MALLFKHYNSYCLFHTSPYIAILVQNYFLSDFAVAIVHGMNLKETRCPICLILNLVWMEVSSY